ncbi:MAG: tyrosine-type recombinase/integrase, partial [bacterium]
ESILLSQPVRRATSEEITPKNNLTVYCLPVGQQTPASVTICLEKFIESRVAKGNSPVTVKWYQKCLFHLVELGWKWPIGPDQLTKFFVHLQTAHRCADATYAMHYRAVRTWLNWCLERGYLESNPMKKAGLKRPRERRTVYQFPSDDQLRAALSYSKETPNGRRDAAILLLMLETGIRPGELLSLRLQGIDWINETITVRGKTGKRMVDFFRTSHVALAAYAQVRPPAQADAFFLSGRELKPLSVFGLRRIFSRLTEVMGFQGRFYPYLMLHMSAIGHLNGGASLFQIQSQLGDRDTETIRTYLEQTRREIREALKRSSPANRLK